MILSVDPKVDYAFKHLFGLGVEPADSYRCIGQNPAAIPGPGHLALLLKGQHE
jgi:hypothetical protein